MKRLIIILLTVLLLSGCIKEYGKPSEVLTEVKISDVYQDPARWKGKLIKVQGAFNWELEGDAIFESKEDLKQRNTRKAISLTLDDPSLKIPYGQQDKNSLWRKILVPLSLRTHIGKPAVVTGVFRTESFGGLYAGNMTVTHLTLK